MTGCLFILLCFLEYWFYEAVFLKLWVYDLWKKESMEKRIVHNKTTNNQVASPFSSTTFGITLFTWLMYFRHLAIVTVFHHVVIPSTSSCFVRGLISLLKNSLPLCHRFSMGFKSGDSGGVFHQLVLFASIRLGTPRGVFGVTILHKPARWGGGGVIVG